MGTEAKNGRKALIEHVQTCIRQVNSMTKLAGEVREANNLLAEQTGTDVTALGGRIDAQGKWLTETEKTAKRADQRVTLLRSDVHDAVSFLLSFTFRDRLRWFLFGVLPANALAREFVAAWRVTPPPAMPVEVPEKRTVIAAPEHVADHGYIPHTSLGPRVLP